MFQAWPGLSFKRVQIIRFSIYDLVAQTRASVNLRIGRFAIMCMGHSRLSVLSSCCALFHSCLNSRAVQVTSPQTCAE